MYREKRYYFSSFEETKRSKAKKTKTVMVAASKYTSLCKRQNKVRW